MNAGKHPLIVPVFVPQAGCPHRCVFCNQVSITGVKPRMPDDAHIASQVTQYLAQSKHKRPHVQLAFFGGNFLGLPSRDIAHLIQVAEKLAEQGKIHSVRFSTRPDTITPERLKIINGTIVSTIEIGAQSMDEQVLNACGRGHAAMDTRHAVSQIKSLGYTVGVQMMVGLPMDTEEKAMATAREIALLSPDFVRIYPTVVLSESVLARWYEKGDYQPLSLEQAVLLVKRIFLEFNTHGIRVIRMGLQPSEELNKTGTLLAGPYHPAFGHLVYSAIVLDRLMHSLAAFGENIPRLDIQVHAKNISRVRGMKNQNLAMVKKIFRHLDIAIAAEERVTEDMMMVNGMAVQLWNRV